MKRMRQHVRDGGRGKRGAAAVGAIAAMVAPIAAIIGLSRSRYSDDGRPMAAQ
jgi:hypothetical protein